MSTILKEYNIHIDPKIKKKLLYGISEERQIIVHCSYTCDYPLGGGIRIWPSTILLDHQSGHRAKLLHHENIPIFPIWKLINPYETIHFTLIFASLPKSCTLFDLKEIIPQDGGFHIKNIKRNKQDVYRVTIA